MVHIFQSVMGCVVSIMVFVNNVAFMYINKNNNLPEAMQYIMIGTHNTLVSVYCVSFARKLNVSPPPPTTTDDIKTLCDDDVGLV